MVTLRKSARHYLLMPKRLLVRYLSLTTEQRAAWITAIAAAAQTFAVCGALIVALYEWQSHRHEDELKQRETTTKLFIEQSGSVRAARDLALHKVFCTDLANSANQLENDINELICKRWAAEDEKATTHPNASTSVIIPSQTSALEAHLEMVELCSQTELCDRSLVVQLFCPDAKLLARYFSIIAPSNGAAIKIPLYRECGISMPFPPIPGLSPWT